MGTDTEIKEATAVTMASSDPSNYIEIAPGKKIILA